MTTPTPHRGLSTSQAADRLAHDGPNELPRARRDDLVRLVLRILREPMLLLLLGALAIYLVIGDAHEAIILGVSLVLVVGITAYQERRTERALEALRDLSSPRALVIRDGKEKRIAAREVVGGDLLVLSEGDRVAADAVVREAVGLAADESLLTGESVPVTKTAEAGEAPPPAPGGDALPFVYSGTLVVRGRGVAEVIATGAHTEMGRIGRSLADTAPPVTPLQRETARVVRLLAGAGVALCVVVVILLAWLRGSLVDASLAGITLAMTVLPEEFPIVLTVFLALGAWRIARHRVLTRRAPAIETLGAATVLAVDKTGTLTENRMRVALLAAGAEHRDVSGASGTLPDTLADVLAVAFRASERAVVDPMERAIVDAAKALAPDAVAAAAAMELVREYDFSSELPAVVHVWRAPGAARAEVAAKGAPEAIATLCRLVPDARESLLRAVSTFAADGLRVLAVARATFEGDDFPGTPHAFALELVGLIGLRDPIRKSVPAAIAECDRAGIRVVMITGDYPETARAAAHEAGIDVSGGILTGPALEALDDDALARNVGAVRVYARMTPAQKLRLVHAFRINGEVVAMTGDGVNDAPALSAAHIGVAMGTRGTDVAREAAALVLLEDDFGSLVATVRAGRRIFENIRNAMSYLLAVHVPLAGMGLVPVLFGWPLFFFPVHVVVLEFIIDPACSLVFEAERSDAELMRRPPRAAGEPLFSRATIAGAVMIGLACLAVVAITYGIALQTIGERAARAMAFATLVVANLTMILVSRSRRELAVATLRHRNAAWWWIASFGLLAIVAVIYVPGAAELFRFEPLPPATFALAVAAGIASVLWFDIVKLARRRLSRAQR